MKKKLLGAVALLFLAFSVLGVAKQYNLKRVKIASNALQVDISTPDALIHTQSLSRLPRDILKIPLANDVLSEDFVFYYEQNEDRLGLKGTLRRIAYEHELSWGDQLIQMVLDEPADMALWRDQKGKLQHYMIAITRSNVARIIEAGAKVAMKDTQLSVAGDMSVDGDKTQIFALKYAYQRQLLVIAHGDRMVILSDPGLLLKPDGSIDDKAAKIIAKLLSADVRKQGLYQQTLYLEPGSNTHSIVVSAHFLSFGYQHFFPGLAALRFDYGNNSWTTQALLDGNQVNQQGIDAQALWQALPFNPSLCVAVPVDWKALSPVLEKLMPSKQEAVKLTEQFKGPAAACWYAGSQLHTPVLVATMNKPASSDMAKVLAALFQNVVGSAEPDGKEAGKTDHASAMKLTKRGNTAWIWSRKVTTPSAKKKSLQVTLASEGDYLVFSPDEKLVAQTLSVIKKRYPALSDELPSGEQTLAWVTPSSLSEVMRREILDSLPSKDEETFRNAANAHLIPRLDALKRQPPFRLAITDTLKEKTVAWYPVSWPVVGKRK